MQVHALEIIHKEQEGQGNGTPLVWVHDYHLMLCANWIRQAADEKNLKLKLGFFLHIPFPPWDIFRLFPWADEILQGMLGNATETTFLSNFSRSLSLAVV